MTREEYDARINDLRDRLRRIGRKYMPPLTAEDIDDAIQEAFANAWEKIHTYDPDRGSFETWVTKIFLNRCYKKTRRLQDQLPENWDAPDVNPELPDFGEMPELQECFEALPGHYQVVIKLQYDDEMSVEETADALHLTIGQVRGYRQRAHQRLRECLLTKDHNLEGL